MPIKRKPLLSSRSISGYVICADSRRAITLTSTAAIPKRLCLKNSRRYRLTRLRTTAHPIFLLAVIPSLATWRLFSRHTTRNPRTAVLWGAEASWINSARFRKRAVFGNVDPVPAITQELKLFHCDSYGQVFTPFCPSTLDNQAAIFCRHSYQKSVGAFTWSITWLICSFHLNLPLQNYFSGNGLLNTTPPLCQVLYYIGTCHHSHWFALKKRVASAILQHLQQAHFYPKYTLTCCFCLFK